MVQVKLNCVNIILFDNRGMKRLELMG